MRFKSAKTGPYQVLAVSGTNTISFAISAAKAGTKGLLGFAVERSDPAGKQDFYAFGFKVFPSLIPKPDEKTKVKTSRHPPRSSTAAGSRWRSACRPSHCSRRWSTTSSSIAASPAARPTRASSATRSRASSTAPSKSRPWNG